MRCNFRRRAISTASPSCSGWSGSSIWQRIDRGISREALEAIGEDEDAAAAVGIDVMCEKMRVTMISAALTALGGAIYGQYFMYLNPETVSGIAVSLADRVRGDRRRRLFACSAPASARC